ncbi:amidase [Phenylobacterium sp.]|jgi:aspartyl-tRNA(Asn)/glutamyl-tRNA(Gln) amidotransferase subunit A|uniref:amidase n=1 Tax=Phenylobacterium sp. TaxID=1871053 RepID=UPI002E30548F|nr:amidase [Phenylobacterium sp.]HEX3365324.1 amidase [Phenylobacterium sp.]
MTPDDALARIRRYDGRLNAFVRVFDPPWGDGSGPVFAIKDLFDVQGVPTGGGAQVPLAENPTANAVVVDKLLAAGWRAIGKTQTVELAYGGWGTNRAVGAPWNPWDAKVHRAPGGSSSGSAAAVAAGFCDAALGSDTGGSVRIPAATCGVVGLKAGRGLVSLKGVHPLAPSLDTVGALAKDVATAARMLGIISGPDGATADRGPFDAEAALTGEVEGRRVAAIPLDHLGEVDADVGRLYLAALDKLRKAGVTVQMVRPPKALDESFAPNGLLMAGEGWRIWRERIERHRKVMDPWIVKRFEVGRDISDDRLAEAQAQRAVDQREFHAWLAAYDGLATPTCPIPGPPMDKVDETTSPLSRLTRAANYLDLPGISVPCGLTGEGMPAGLQIIGRPRDEATVVALGAAFEKVSGWNGRRPDMSGFG